MKQTMRILQGLKLAAVLAVALSMGACANKNMTGMDANANAATPGSQQDFVVNVGDRVFFESDQTDLTPRRSAPVERGAGAGHPCPRNCSTRGRRAAGRAPGKYSAARAPRRAQS